MSKTIAVFGDVHAPIEDRKLVKAFTRFVGEFQPDELVCIGDLLDLPQPSRWSKDTKEEFEGSVFADAEHARKRVIAPIRDVYDGPFKFIPGNHDTRGTDYLRRYAPALGESHAFDPDILMDFDSFGIETVGPFYEFAPEWVMLHGHLGGVKLSQDAGKSALNAATNKFHKNVVHGHTHRGGVMTKSFGYDSTVTRTLTGVETGHMVDMRLAAYLKKATANWQSGFALFHVENRLVHPQFVRVDKQFIVEGEVYTL